MFSLTDATQIALSEDLSCGAVLPRVYISDLFDAPTTLARKYNGLYVVNAKLATDPADIPSTSYQVLRLNRDDGLYVCSP